MPSTTFSSREFNQDTAGAKMAARKGPVFITDRGRAAHVLLSIEEYQRLTQGRLSLSQALAQPGPEADFAFQPEVARPGFRDADLD